MPGALSSSGWSRATIGSMSPDAATRAHVRSNQWPAITVATFATPLVPAIVMAVWAGLVNSTIAAAMFTFKGAYVIALVLVAFPGLPVFLLMRQLRWVRWWTALMTGLVFGVGVWFAISSPGVSIWSGVFLGSVGALTALVFWLIWRTSVVRQPFDHLGVLPGEIGD